METQPEPGMGNSLINQQIREFLQKEWTRLVETHGLQAFMQQMVETLQSLESRISALEKSGAGESAGGFGPAHQVIQLNDYAVQLFHMNQLDQAEQILHEAISHHPENALIWNNLAVVQTHLGKQDDALKSFSRAISLDDQSVEMLNNQGVLALLEQQPEKSIQILEQAQRMDPQRIDVLLNLASAYEAANQPDKSLSLWQTVLLLDPGQLDARQKLREYYQYD